MTRDILQTLPDVKQLTPYVHFLPSSENPLSSDIGIVESKNAWWIFDTGCCDRAAEVINTLYNDGNKTVNVVISHFHEDHITNVNRIKCNSLYLSKKSLKHVEIETIERLKAEGTQIVVPEENLLFNDGIQVKIVCLPSCHCSGSLVLEANGEYAFLGDAIYCDRKNGIKCYNATVLLEEIKVLDNMEAAYFFISHDRLYIRQKRILVSQLKGIYAQRKKNEPYIWVE